MSTQASDWQVPAATLRWLDAVPADRGVAMLVRHSVRDPFAARRPGYANALNAEGVALARSLGERLHGRLRSLQHQPAAAVAYTAEVFVAGDTPPILTDRMLGDPRRLGARPRAGGRELEAPRQRGSPIAPGDHRRGPARHRARRVGAGSATEPRRRRARHARLVTHDILPIAAAHLPRPAAARPWALAGTSRPPSSGRTRTACTRLSRRPPRQSRRKARFDAAAPCSGTSAHARAPTRQTQNVAAPPLVAADIHARMPPAPRGDPPDQGDQAGRPV